jgi:nitric oxide reductase NorQ protein
MSPRTTELIEPADPVEPWRETAEPYYRSQGHEVGIFEAAFRNRLAVLLKGPTGCGKTRLVRHMAWRLGRPLVTVACHEDLTATDLVGRFLLRGGETIWADGPLTTGVRHGAVVYLDEVVEARKDIVVVIHPLADDRRILPVEKLDTVLKAPPEFMLVASFNPGYQSALKDLKQSTRQRFVSITLGYPRADLEAQILVHETGIDDARAARLVTLGTSVRRMVDEGLEEGASTRVLIHAATLIRSGVPDLDACQAAIAEPLTDDPDLRGSIQAVAQAILG